MQAEMPARSPSNLTSENINKQLSISNGHCPLGIDH
jgi:hypothetical protein